MRLCRREGLHQVDLLVPAKTKITEKEYRAKTNGQKDLDELNKRIIEAQMKPSTTVFKTQKQFLRDAILETAGQACSLEEFQKLLLDKHGISLKDRRGRFSYLHPARKKYITGRALGSDFEKEHLMEILAQNAVKEDRELGRSGEADPAHGEDVATKIHVLGKTYDPSYDYHADPVAILYIHSEIRLVVDLQNSIKAQQSEAYARKVKLSNLKEMALTVVFIQENGFDSYEELVNEHERYSAITEEQNARLNATGEELRRVNAAIHYAGQYYSTRTVHADFLKARNKKKFREEHLEELERYDEAVRYFKENYDGKILSMKKLKERKEELVRDREKQKSRHRNVQQIKKTLQTAVANVDCILSMGQITERTAPGKTVSMDPEL